MDFSLSERAQTLRAEVTEFFDTSILPRDRDWADQVEHGGDTNPQFLSELRAMAFEKGLWNMALPRLADNEPGTRLSNLEFAIFTLISCLCVSSVDCRKTFN